jgi:hypothetical protein
MFTWIGIFNSDSGKESILKFVFERKGLSGIIFFEHEVANSRKKQTKMEVGFKELNIASKIPVILYERKHQIIFLTNQ